MLGSRKIYSFTLIIFWNMYIKRGDNIIVIAGKDKGRKGKVTRALSAVDKVVVEGINMKKKHQRPRKEGQKGQVIEIASPLNVSNVQLLDPKTNKPTRVGYKVIKGKKVRIARKSGVEI